MTAVHGVADPAVAAGRRFPPVAELTTGSLGLVIIGGILLASYAPRRPPLTAPVALAVVATLLLLAALVLLGRLQEFDWGRFRTFFQWALLAYVLSAGMIGFAFIHDHVRGAPLAVVTWLLVLFAVNVPLIIAFTVARYSSAPRPAD